jgi:hypothetical protein
VSRGLGLAQREALTILDERPHGILVADLATLLNLTPRRGRAVVASLVDRGLAVTTREPGSTARRVWQPKLRSESLMMRGYVAGLIDSVKNPRPKVGGIFCPCCNFWIEQQEPRYVYRSAPRNRETAR